jgi:hypothetical protein
MLCTTEIKAYSFKIIIIGAMIFERQQEGSFLLPAGLASGPVLAPL